MKNIIIIGAGGVGKEVTWIIEQINKKNPTYNIVGFIDDNKLTHGKTVNGYIVLGDLSYIEKNNSDYEIVIAIANYKIKKGIVEKLEKKDIKYSTIIHPKISLPKDTFIGEGSILYEGIIISPNVKIGNHVIISPKCGIGHDSIIKDYASLLWNVNVSGNDIIEEGVLLGSGSTIIQNKKVGLGSIVGAGAVVINDVNKYKTVVGIPARLKL